MKIKLVKAYGTWGKGQIVDVPDSIGELLIQSNRAINYKWLQEPPAHKAVMNPARAKGASRGK